MSVVTIKRRNDYSQILPKELRSEVKKKIASHWVGGTKDLLRGLTQDEEKEYLPEVVGISTKSEHWDAKIRQFWADFEISVPEEGLKIDITKDVKTGKYKNVNDMIIYKFCLNHFEVAVRPEELAEKDAFPFHIVNEEVEQKKDFEVYELRKKANAEFHNLVNGEDRSKIEHVFYLIRENSELMPSGSEALEMRLEQLKDKFPNKFSAIISDENLKYKAFIFKALENRIIIKSGNTYYDGDAPLGELNDAILWLKNPINSSSFLALKERLKAVTK